MEIKLNDEMVQKVVETEIATRIATVLGKDPDRLIQKVVTSALAQKKDRYSRQTLFSASINEMIREAARDTFKVWLDKQRPKIRKAIDDRLTKEKTEFIASIADQLVNGLKSSFYVSCRLKAED